MPRKGERIGPYTLIEKLGRGSFGVVWLAENRTALAVTKVALKLPNDEDVDLEAIKQEASLWVAASGHPNVLPIIEANIYDEQVVIVSEYAPDGSLAQWLKNNRGCAPTIKEAVEITMGILSGLEHLHTRKIIHRDLKPANILLQGSTPRLVDFGLSRVMRSTSHSRAVSGTYQYMPPESFKGERSPQTDIWSAGVILYEMLCGRMPFPQQDDPSLLYAILNDPPAALPSSVPDRLREVITKALSKDTTERYKTVAEMRERLMTALEPIIQIQPEPREAITKAFPKPNEQQTLVLPQEPVNTSPSPRQQADTLKGNPQIRQQTATPQINEPPKKISRRALLFGFGAFASVLLVGAIGLQVFQSIYLSGSSVSSSNANQPKPTLTNTNTTQPESLPKEFTSKIGMKFVLIPSGEFMMGSSDLEVQAAYEDAKRYDSKASLDQYKNEKPKHRVTINYSFYMGKFEVTQAQWLTIMGKNPSKFKKCDDCPIEHISWKMVQEFIKKLNSLSDEYTYRLPSEAEWEYACRARTTTAFSFGESVSSSQANFDGREPYGNVSKGEYKAKTTKVGSYQPNDFGLYDMHGNVWEWCEDVYTDSYTNSPNDGSANVSTTNAGKRVFRSGGWGCSGWCLRSASRAMSSKLDDRWSDVGFRLVASAKSQ